MSGRITIGTAALDALGGQLESAAALAEGTSRTDDGGTVHPEVASALAAFRVTWDDRRSELATQLRKAANGCRGVSAHATAVDQAGARTLRGR